MITFVVTVEPGSTLESTRNALEMALKETGARLPACQWMPDRDTIADAYGAPDMKVFVLNP